MQSIKVLFFGSGPVAAASLELLLASSVFEVEAVITKPNPAHHHGAAPVIELCEHKNSSYITPANKHELSQAFATSSYKSTVGIVIDYGIIIEQSVIDYFEHGIINSHFSLLPEWRGADPITFSLLSGQPLTGVSLMSINAAMDEGPLLAQEQLVIQPDYTSESLTHKLIQLSNTMLAKQLPALLDGNLALHQQVGQPSYSRKLVKADGLLDWSKPATVLEREIRAYHQWPKSTGIVGKHHLIVRSADVINATGEPGTFQATKKTLTVFCGEDALELLIVQPVNKKEMPIQAFLAGYSL